MKSLRKLLWCVLIVLPLLSVPKTSRAGDLGDLFGWLFGDDDDKHKKGGDDGGCNGGGGGTKSAPINEGLVILLVGGLGLGAVMSQKLAKTKTSL